MTGSVGVNPPCGRRFASSPTTIANAVAFTNAADNGFIGSTKARVASPRFRSTLFHFLRQGLTQERPSSLDLCARAFILLRF
jgi:hypothetical protein